MSPKSNRAAALDKPSADQLTRALLSLLVPHVRRRMVRSTPGVRHVQTFIRRVPDFRPRQPRSVAISSALISAYLKAATAAKH